MGIQNKIEMLITKSISVNIFRHAFTPELPWIIIVCIYVDPKSIQIAKYLWRNINELRYKQVQLTGHFTTNTLISTITPLLDVNWYTSTEPWHKQYRCVVGAPQLLYGSWYCLSSSASKSAFSYLNGSICYISIQLLAFHYTEFNLRSVLNCSVANIFLNNDFQRWLIVAFRCVIRRRATLKRAHTHHALKKRRAVTFHSLSQACSNTRPVLRTHTQTHTYTSVIISKCVCVCVCTSDTVRVTKQTHETFKLNEKSNL